MFGVGSVRWVGIPPHCCCVPPVLCMSQSDGAPFLVGIWLFPLFSSSVIVTGSRLLSADADGHIKCWSMTDHLANSWENTVGSVVEGDPVVALSWLHNGVKLALHVEKVCLSFVRDLGWNLTQVLARNSGYCLCSLGFLVALGSFLPVEEKSDSWFLLNSEGDWSLVSLGVSPLVWYLSSRQEYGDRAVLSLLLGIQRPCIQCAKV